jgi:hypothetical protein
MQLKEKRILRFACDAMIPMVGGRAWGVVMMCVCVCTCLTACGEPASRVVPQLSITLEPPEGTSFVTPWARWIRVRQDAKSRMLGAELLITDGQAAAGADKCRSALVGIALVGANKQYWKTLPHPLSSLPLDQSMAYTFADRDSSTQQHVYGLPELQLMFHGIPGTADLEAINSTIQGELVYVPDFDLERDKQKYGGSVPFYVLGGKEPHRRMVGRYANGMQTMAGVYTGKHIVFTGRLAEPEVGEPALVTLLWEVSTGKMIEQYGPESTYPSFTDREDVRPVLLSDERFAFMATRAEWKIADLRTGRVVQKLGWNNEQTFLLGSVSLRRISSGSNKDTHILMFRETELPMTLELHTVSIDTGEVTGTVFHDSDSGYSSFDRIFTTQIGNRDVVIVAGEYDQKIRLAAYDPITLEYLGSMDFPWMYVTSYQICSGELITLEYPTVSVYSLDALITQTKK